MRARAQGGFTLLEVVVAFVVLSLALTTIFQIFSAGLARAGELDGYTRALAVAESKLASTGVESPLQEGESSGETPDRAFRWRVSVLRDPETEPAAQTRSIPLSLYRVEVRVGWRAGDGREREVRLSTLQLGART